MSYAITHKTLRDYDSAPWLGRSLGLAREVFAGDSFGIGIGVTALTNEIVAIQEERSFLPAGLENDQVEDYLVGLAVNAVINADDLRPQWAIIYGAEGDI